MPFDPDDLPLTHAPRLFCAERLPEAGMYLLPKAVGHHAVRVLRLATGDAVTLFDGSGGEHAAQVAGIAKDCVEVVLGDFSAVEREAPFPIRLVQCLQGGDKMDFTVQKAVELGVAEIVPVGSQRSVVRLDSERAAKRVRHWRQIVIAASEQCGRNRLAEVRDVESLDRYLARPAAAGVVRLCLEPGAAMTVSRLPAPSAVEFLIGPEGGLSPAEAEAARLAGFGSLRLGPRVLRTETAGLAALAALHARWGDFL